MRDASAKRRFPSRHGTHNPAAKLSPAQVVAIRRAAAEGMPQRAIGRQFGLAQGQVSNIVLRKTWASLDGFDDPAAPSGYFYSVARG